MRTYANLPWTKINDFLLAISTAQTSTELYKSALNRIDALIPFDTAILYLLNDTLKPDERVLIGVKPSLSDDYLNYYIKLHNEKFSYVKATPMVIDWANVEDCEYKTDYIKPQRVHSSASFIFYNSDRWPKAAFVINRTGKCGYTATEKETLTIIRRHLANLHGIFMNAADRRPACDFNVDISKPLTKRESEMVELLAKGMSPGQISKRKFISLHTVYNHLANIYKKTNVSNQRELLSKIMQPDCRFCIKDR